MFILDTKFEYDTKFVLHTNASTRKQFRFNFVQLIYCIGSRLLGRLD